MRGDPADSSSRRSSIVGTRRPSCAKEAYGTEASSATVTHETRNRLIMAGLLSSQCSPSGLLHSCETDLPNTTTARRADAAGLAVPGLSAVVARRSPGQPGPHDID